MPEKFNVTTVNWTKETIQEFEAAWRKAGYRSRAHYFDVVGLALIEQIKAGEKLVYPARLQTEKAPRIKRPRGRPRRK